MLKDELARAVILVGHKVDEIARFRRGSKKLNPKSGERLASVIEALLARIIGSAGDKGARTYGAGCSISNSAFD